VASLIEAIEIKRKIAQGRQLVAGSRKLIRNWKPTPSCAIVVRAENSPPSHKRLNSSSGVRSRAPCALCYRWPTPAHGYLSPLQGVLDRLASLSPTAGCRGASNDARRGWRRRRWPAAGDAHRSERSDNRRNHFPRRRRDPRRGDLPRRPLTHHPAAFLLSRPACGIRRVPCLDCKRSRSPLSVPPRKSPISPPHTS
jgi:hypothetical protein